jgi:hypothetical protein
VFRVFVAGLLMTFRLVLFETLMQGAAKKHRTQTLALCWHTSLQAFWLVSKSSFYVSGAFNKDLLRAQAIKACPLGPYCRNAIRFGAV